MTQLPFAPADFPVFSSLRAGRWRWQIDASLEIADLLPYLKDPGRFFEPPAQSLQDNADKRRSEIVTIAIPGPAQVVVKRYQPKNLWKSLATVFRPAPAMEVLRRALQLRQLGIATPAPVAAGWRGCAGFVRESCLVTRAVPGARSLREYYFTPPGPGGSLKRVLRSLAGTIARLHDAQIAHTDLHLGNFLITGPGPNQEIFLVDLEALRPRKHFTLRIAAEDLRRFWQRPPVRDRERLYFLAAYCRARSPRVSPAEILSLMALKS